jgi:BTB/POZ domain-containing protein KCTD9
MASLGLRFAPSVVSLHVKFCRDGFGANQILKMDASMPDRISYELSCNRLRELGLLADDDQVPMPERVPQYDDEEPLGVNFFRTRLADALDLSGVSLPRTFFGRSEINGVSFRNSDLQESNLCWNDFLTVDFTGADLSHSDMRSSIFRGVQFVATNLAGADLRRSSFMDCAFESAVMTGAALTRRQGSAMRLSPAQRDEIDWRDEEGPEPGGG